MKREQERRFRQRLEAAELKLEIRPVNWLNAPGKSYQAIAKDFAIGGMAIISPLKLKPGKRLLINISNADHRLCALPTTITRVEQQDGDFIYGLKFALGQFPELASRGAYTILQRFEQTLSQASQN